MASGRKSTSMRTTEGATRRVASRTKAFIFLRGGGVGVGTAGERASASAAWTLRSGMMKDAAGGTGRMREVPVVVVGIGRGSARAKAEGGLHACARAAAPERSAAASLGRHGEAGGRPGPGGTGKPRSAVADAVGRDDASGAGWATPRGARETDGGRRGRPRAAVGIGRRATASLVLISGETTTGNLTTDIFFHPWDGPTDASSGASVPADCESRFHAPVARAMRSGGRPLARARGGLASTRGRHSGYFADIRVALFASADWDSYEIVTDHVLPRLMDYWRPEGVSSCVF